MDDTIASEVRGDASNLKGIYYHLLYVLWLLLKNVAESVHFFQGNDLLAKPTPPPSPQSCQTDILRNLKPFSHLRPADIFQPEAPISLSHVDSLAPVASDVLDIFTDGELREAVSRRVASEKVEEILVKLQDPASALLRHPYALNIYFIENKHAPTESWGALPSDECFHYWSTASRVC